MKGLILTLAFLYSFSAICGDPIVTDKEIVEKGLSFALLLQIEEQRQVLFPDYLQDRDTITGKLNDVRRHLQGQESVQAICTMLSDISAQESHVVRVGNWCAGQLHRLKNGVKSICGSSEIKPCTNYVGEYSQQRIKGEAVVLLNDSLRRAKDAFFDAKTGIPDFKTFCLYSKEGAHASCEEFLNSFLPQLKDFVVIVDCAQVKLDSFYESCCSGLESSQKIRGELEDLKTTLLENKALVETVLEPTEAYIAFENRLSNLRAFFQQAEFANMEVMTAALFDRFGKVSAQEWIEDVLRFGPKLAKLRDVDLIRVVRSALAKNFARNCHNAMDAARELSKHLFRNDWILNDSNRQVALEIMEEALAQLNRITIKIMNDETVNGRSLLSKIDATHRIVFVAYQYLGPKVGLNDAKLKTITKERHLARNGMDNILQAYSRLLNTLLKSLGVRDLDEAATKSDVVDDRDLAPFWKIIAVGKHVRQWSQDNPLEFETVASELGEIYRLFAGRSDSFTDDGINFLSAVRSRRMYKRIVQMVLFGFETPIVDSGSVLSPEVLALIDIVPKLRLACEFGKGSCTSNPAKILTRQILGIAMPALLADMASCAIGGTVRVVQGVASRKLADAISDNALADAGVSGALEVARSGDFYAAAKAAAVDFALVKSHKVLQSMQLSWSKLLLVAVPAVAYALVCQDFGTATALAFTGFVMRPVVTEKGRFWEVIREIELEEEIREKEEKKHA